MLDSTLNQPNGLVGTPDGKYLYVAEAKANRILRYDIQTDGSLTNRQVFADMGSDGMTIDDRGNIYLTGDGVTAEVRKNIFRGTKNGGASLFGGHLGDKD